MHNVLFNLKTYTFNNWLPAGAFLHLGLPGFTSADDQGTRSPRTGISRS